MKNRNFEFDESSHFDSGVGLELYGSFAAGLSTKTSDLDMRINDFYSYRYLNLDKIIRVLTFVPGQEQSCWTGALSKKSRIQVLDHIKTAKVPILKLKDRKTQIEFDISQGSSSVNNRHAQICKAA